MSDACRRKFDAILVWKIDRFGRSLKHLVNALAELAALGVGFISLRFETKDCGRLSFFATSTWVRPASTLACFKFPGIAHNDRGEWRSSRPQDYGQQCSSIPKQDIIRLLGVGCRNND